MTSPNPLVELEIYQEKRKGSVRNFFPFIKGDWPRWKWNTSASTKSSIRLYQIIRNKSMLNEDDYLLVNLIRMHSLVNLIRMHSSHHNSRCTFFTSYRLNFFKIRWLSKFYMLSESMQDGRFKFKKVKTKEKKNIVRWTTCGWQRVDSSTRNGQLPPTLFKNLKTYSSNFLYIFYTSPLLKFFKITLIY